MAFTEKRLSRRRNVLFGIMIIVLVYALVSAAIAINTVDECGNGDESAAKHWSFFPPEWVCD